MRHESVDSRVFDGHAWVPSAINDHDIVALSLADTVRNPKLFEPLNNATIQLVHSADDVARAARCSETADDDHDRPVFCSLLSPVDICDIWTIRPGHIDDIIYFFPAPTAVVQKNALAVARQLKYFFFVVVDANYLLVPKIYPDIQ